MGSLHATWTEVPEDVGAEEWREAFRNHFGEEWEDVLDAAEKSPAYCAACSVFFAVRDLRPLVNQTLEDLAERTGGSRPPNIIAA